MRRLPGDLPAWLTVRRLFGAAHGLGLLAALSGWAAMLTSNMVTPDLQHPGDLVAWLGVVVGVLGTLLFGIGTPILVARAKSALGALGLSILGTAGAFGVLYTAVGLHVLVSSRYDTIYDAQLARGVHWEHVPTIIAFGMILGGILGAVVGALLARPMMWAIRARATRAVMSGRALLGIGVWLLVPAAMAFIGGFFGSLAPGNADSPFVLAGLVTPLLAAAGAILGASLLYRRARWLDKVRRGEVPRFRVRVAAQEEPGVPRLETSTKAERDDLILEEVIAVDDDPYRGAQLAQPIARVD